MGDRGWGWDWDWDEEAAGSAGQQLPAEGALGIALRAARDAAGLSQQELARRAGVSQPVVSRLERGGSHGRPSWALFCRLLDSLGLEPVVTTRPKSAALTAAMDRLAAMTPAERWEDRSLSYDVDRLARELPPKSWALDGEAALVAHGVPVEVESLAVVLLDDDTALAQTLDVLVRAYAISVIGADPRTGVGAFPADRCAMVMRQAVDEPLRWAGYPLEIRIVEALPPTVEVRLADALVPVVTVDRVRAESAASVAAVEHWFVRARLDK